jgi:hypothetical protein
MTNSSTYIVFGAPVVGIAIGYCVLSFLRIAGRWASQERAQLRAPSPETVYHVHVRRSVLYSAPIVAADAVKKANLMMKLAAGRRENDHTVQAEEPLANHG